MDVIVTIVATSLLLASMASPATAQQSDGTIRGRISDSTGASVPSAVLHLTGTRLGAYSGSAGEYTIDHIAAGSYTVTVRRPASPPTRSSSRCTLARRRRATSCFALPSISSRE